MIPRTIRPLRRLPISWQHKLRQAAEMAEYYSEALVITEDGMAQLIENTATPDFVEYDRRLAVMQKRWGWGDPELQRLAIRRRFVEHFAGKLSTTKKQGES
jgi:hypothetical protein